MRYPGNSPSGSSMASSSRRQGLGDTRRQHIGSRNPGAGSNRMPDAGVLRPYRGRSRHAGSRACSSRRPCVRACRSERKKEPAFAGPYIGQVGQPNLVRCRCHEVPAQPVRGDRVVVTAVRGADATWDRGQPSQACASHEACDAVPTDAPTRGAQDGVNARRAMASAAFRMGAAEVAEKGPVLDAATAFRPPTPGTMAAGRDAEHGADRSNGPEMAMLIDEPEDHRLAPAKTSAAFLRISRSISAF